VWDTAGSPHTLALRGHTSKVFGASWSPDGRRIASASFDRTVRIWDAGTGALLHVIAEDDMCIDVCWLLRGQLLAYKVNIVGGDQESTRQRLRVVRSHDWSPVYSLEMRSTLCVSDDGCVLAAGHRDGNISIREAETGLTLSGWTAHRGVVEAVAYSPDGQMLASAAQDTLVKLWRTGDNSLFATLRGHTGSAQRLAFSPDGDYLASGDSEGEVIIWETQTGEPVASFVRKLRMVLSLAFTPECNQLLCCWRGGKLALHRVPDGRHTADFDEDIAASYVEFSPDGNRLVVCSKSDGTFFIWDALPRESV
jgi:WD40 repeat protein